MKKIIQFYREKIVPLIAKIKHVLTHNFIIRFEIHRVVFFSFIRIKVTNQRRQSTIGLLFVLIWIIGYLVFALYPMGYSLFLSFFKVKRDGQALYLIFKGIENYKAAFLYDPNFKGLLAVYVTEMLMNVPITIVFALVIAMLINQDIRGKGFWRMIFFLPVIIISGPVIQELMDQGATTLPSIENYQVIDLILRNLNPALGTPIQALFDRILLVLWFAGIQILIFLAGLQKIDKEIYEASMIDGAGPWESFWKITLPAIMPLVGVTIIYTVVSMSVFSLNSVIIYIRTIMMGNSTDVLINGYGYSAAISWIYFVTMVVIILVFVGLISIRKRSRT